MFLLVKRYIFSDETLKSAKAIKADYLSSKLHPGKILNIITT